MASAAAKLSTDTKVNMIGGFMPARVNLAVMKKFLMKAKVSKEKVDPSVKDAEQMALALTLNFRETTSPDDLCECEQCKGQSPDTLTACPFCGMEGPTDEADDEAKEEDDAAEESKPDATEDGDEDAEEDDAEEDDGEVVTSAEQIAAEDEPVSAPKKVSAAKRAEVKKAASKKLAKTTDEAFVPEVIDADGSVVYTVQDLDDRLQRIKNFKVATSGAVWALGNELRAITENNLWKLRVNAKGKASYTSFDQFLEDEAKISTTYAYQLIGITKKFTEADIAEFGTTKLAIVLKAPDFATAGLLEKVKKGTPVRALDAHVRQIVEETGETGSTKSKKHSAAGKKSGELSTAKGDKITIATIEGRKTIALMQKPASLRNLKWDTLKPAKNLKQLPFGKLQLTNEVTLLISVMVGPDGNLKAIVDVRRDNAAEE